ncbi:hypothetical protein RRF57_007620 [Xylaria bambusicola]|uniref:Uncharacterized protein n=1 Tax=Xylaria bambusicola TaxID=326684 RepID=A0AAN7USA9_9PEZI
MFATIDKLSQAGLRVTTTKLSIVGRWESEFLSAEAVESAEGESPRSSVNAVTANVEVGTEMSCADTLGVEERHFEFLEFRVQKGVNSMTSLVRRIESRWNG